VSGKPFHLAWFLHGSSAQSWGQPWTGRIGDSWMYPELFLDMARALERACFDYILLEDSTAVSESLNGSSEVFLRRGIAVPRQDKAIVAALMTQVTSRIGIVPTFGTYAYHPYLLARQIATLDQVSGGRIGWNVVTGSSDLAAMNFGMDALPEHDKRYDMADEYIEACRGLWGAWDTDAVIADREGGVLIDPDKVRPYEFRGQHYRTRGPLNAGPCPQGQPVIAQAGGSSRGRRFAARHSETIVAQVKTVEAMKAYRDDVRRHMVEQGRDPDACKVMFTLDPILGETVEDAEQRNQRRLAWVRDNIEERLAGFAKVINVDFSKFDLDKPLPDDVTTNGHQQLLADYRTYAAGRSIRDTLSTYDLGLPELVGSPDSVAGQLAEIMEEVGGDGFLFSKKDVTRRTLAEVEDGLVPALQARGLVRRGYEHTMFRDNLLSF
jgi:FMN-dependent oxidoreductase (nitrilotriacetate monooxygenase family)